MMTMPDPMAVMVMLVVMMTTMVPPRMAVRGYTQPVS